MKTSVPRPPFQDDAALKAWLQSDLYGIPPEKAGPVVNAFFGVASDAEQLAIPARINSGKTGTMQTAWYAMYMNFFDLASQRVVVDDIFLGDDGYKVVFFGRWSGRCSGPCKFADGTAIDLTGKTFEDLRYSYILTFSRDTKRVVLLEGQVDLAEWGRKLGSREFAVASALTPLYPA